MNQKLFATQLSQLVQKISLYLEYIQYQDPKPFIFKEIPKVYFPIVDFNKVNSKNIEPSSNIPPIEPLEKENKACKLCSDRVYAVKEYFKLPKNHPQSILVVHYNGSLDPKRLPRDHSDAFYFSSKEEDENFQRMIEKFNLRLENLYFQEFLACHFSPYSTNEEWEVRKKNCMGFLEKHLEEYNIKKILLIGNAALLLLGEVAIDIAKRSQIISLTIKNQVYPTIVLRSPSAILALEKKRKEYFEILQKQYPEEYQAFLKQKNNLEELIKSIKDQILEHQNIKVVNNIRLVKASQIKNENEIEKEIQKKLGINIFYLYKAIKYRLEEIQIKEQILNSLKKLLESDV